MAILSIPLELAEIDPGSYHIFIPCIINQTPCDLLIDTGASRTVFDLQYLDNIVQSADQNEIISSGVGPGQLDTRVGQLSSLTLGGHTWDYQPAMFMDLNHINQLYEKVSAKKIAGLIGGDFLVRTCARISYLNHTLKFKIPSQGKSLFL